ncbi:hypothetical protein PFNF54_00442 [Plasmodium falciparum NF54]|nr:hypothetical protein PFNF54_00442 [Plasmodium falciparum NF54]
MAGIQLCEAFESNFIKINNNITDTNTKPNIPPMYNMNTNNYVDSPNMNENIDMIKLYPYNNNFNINYNNFRNLYEESQYNLFNFYNPALHIFPIDLTNMNYDEYIYLYEKSQLVWQQKMLQMKANMNCIKQ